MPRPWAIGGPVFGWLSDRLGRRKPLYALGCLVILLGWGLILLLPALPMGLPTLLLLLVGFFSGNMIILETAVDRFVNRITI